MSFKLQIHIAPLFQHQLLLPVLSTKGVVLALASLDSMGAHRCAVWCVYVHTRLHIGLPLLTKSPCFLTTAGGTPEF